MSGIRTAVIYGVIALVIVFVLAAVPLYVDWLWFLDLGYANVFSTILVSKVLLGVVAGIIFFLVIWGSAWYALRANAGSIELYTMDVNLPIFLDRMIRRGVEFVVLFGAIIVSILAGLEAATHWESWLQFRNYVPFGTEDPIFGVDIGFYVFRLDFLLFVYRSAMVALIAAGIAAAAILYLTRTVDFLAGKLKITNVAAGHLGIILALIAGLQAVGFRLRAYELLFKQGPTVFGIGYTDAHVRLLSLNAAIIASLIGAAVVLYAARQKNLPLAAAGLLLGFAVNMVVGGAVGALVQRLVVNPDELGKEQLYLAHHIKATQQAYALDAVRRKNVDISGTLTSADLENNRVTLQSVRLWDYEPLKAAYQQLQEIQQYYTFEEVDIDRYTIDGVYRQVMLSAREIESESLPARAQTWVNIRLKYTHGYGLAMSPVNEVNQEGLPRLFIRDLPPDSGGTGIEVERPGVYFGEKTNEYVLVDTKVQEFDYPKGSEGVYTKYQSDSGVNIGGFFRRALLAVRFADLNLVLPGNLDADSRILFRRTIRDRVHTIAPFLRMDYDPYLVVSRGRLLWIQDAYTHTDRYPYSDPVPVAEEAMSLTPSKLNYIRNSVKIVLDAYTGEVDFYSFDDRDPILRTYRKAFPGLFKPSSEMPEDLRSHIRYPEDLFRIQTAIYQTYHMTDTQQFYNKGDLWAVPTLESQDASQQEQMAPYYVVMKLPDAEREEFILLLPYRRADKQNMVAWLAAKCDDPEYGQLILFEFPKGEQYYGPAQVQARANQNTEISEQMTLWNQQKSSVSRGNLLVIPIEDSILYVEPLYLQATNARIPEFKRVIVSLGNEVTMQPTLSEALEVLIGDGAGAAPAASPEAGGEAPTTQERPSPPRSQGEADVVRRARALYEQAVEAQRRGDWAEYGRRQRELGDLLERSSGGAAAD